MESKIKYYSRLSYKRLDSKTSPKSYWSILKTFLNDKKDTLHSTSVAQCQIHFKEKAELFNDFFFQSSALLLITTVNFPHVSHFPQLSFRHIIF